MRLEERIAAIVGRAPSRTVPLSGGCVGDVRRVEFASGAPLVAKVDASGSGALDVEGFMLQRLAGQLPVPAVVHAAPELLLMEWVEGDSRFDSRCERHAAELLARLHSVTAERFGLARTTLIGGLRQPNDTAGSWCEFFARHRLVYMAGLAHEHGRLPARLRDRVGAFAGALAGFVDEPRAPALLHGDVWSGNVLARDGRISAFLDPAIYFGHPETELAFVTMFSTFGDAFFRAYSEVHPIEPGFFEERRHVHNLYPLLVHVRLFGGSYVRSVEATLERFGY